MQGAGDWDARSYHAVSDPQFGWGLRVLDRLELSGSETVLDVSCGSGRLTTRLATRLPRGRAIGLDLSPSMLQTARDTVAGEGLHVEFVRADATRLPFSGSLDAVFSTATFHWVPDHEALFASICTALRPGGRLVAQCGGGPNLARARERAGALMCAPSFELYFRDWHSPWNYATPEETAARLHAAGFADASASLESAPATFPDAAAYEAFATTVILRPYLACLPEGLHPPFTHALAQLAAGDEPPYTLDYWRLNISAAKP